MAATPPKPPGDFLKELNDCISNNNKNNTKKLNKEESNQDHIQKQDNTNNALSENCINKNDNKIETPTTAQKSNCSCTNISIMHLFHEMKQEFPTIPDTIVTQCVNENCHQRENCIQQLRNELALNPIPVPSYPGKVLHPTTQRQQSVPKSVRTPNSTHLGTPLKPTRPAPLQPPNYLIKQSLSPRQSGLQSTISPFEVHSTQQKPFCDSVSSISNNINNNNNKSKQDKCNQFEIPLKDDNNISESAKKESTITKASDMPTATINNNCECVNASQKTSPIDNRENVNPNEVQLQSGSLVSQPPAIVPRSRPTTLNLPTQYRQLGQQQREYRQQVNTQLQQQIQQRNQQQQIKPLRAAPHPPIPRKPPKLTNAGAYSPLFNHSYTNNNNNVNNNCILANSQQSSFSNDSNLTSPSSSVGESEISVNVSLSSPIVAYQPATTTPPISQKSPLRHRSVITVHPTEPAYSQNFTASSPTGTAGVSPGQKSFTSVNLTLRQPNLNSDVPASTIDISAGPGFSGNGSGLTYSSTSYDARLGFKKNFHITVTDEGGVFSASRVRPHSSFYPGSEHEQDGETSPTTSNKVNILRPASSEQCISQQLQNTNPQLLYQQDCRENFVIPNNNTTEMCLPKENDEIVERQKARRDKLATALRDNKKRLNQVEEEIHVLAEPVRPDETERLDEEIQKLRCDCQAMLNEIDISKRCGPSLNNNMDSNQFNNRQLQPQAFPRQRHHRTSAFSSPTLSGAPQNQQHHNISTPPQSSPYIPNLSSQQPLPSYPGYSQQPLVDEDEYSDSNTDADDNEEEEPQEKWACSMCTFHNHPQLNICECCENVRIPREPMLSREDIHIILSPGENRIIHSWIVS